MKYYFMLLTCLVLGQSLHAQWGNTPAENLKLSQEQGLKINKMALAGPDGSWYICYTNLVVNTQSLHLTRIDETGQTRWTKIIKDSEAPGNLSAVMISDSLGGVILAWTDRRTENTAFTYANRIDSDGNKLWGENDVRVGISEIEEFLTKMVPDGQNGAIITMYDDNPPNNNFRGIYAYRVRANGQVAWRSYLFPSGTNGHNYDIDHDSQGGLVAVMEYGHPTELENQIRGMRLDSTGAKVWPDETFDIGPLSQPIGMLVKSSTRSHTYPRITVYPKQGFYVSYFENPGILFPDEALSHRAHLLDMDGHQIWDIEGIPLNRPATNSPNIQTIVDPEGNLYFNYHTDSAFKLQKVTPSGTLPWSMEGIPYSSAFQGAPDNLLLTSCNDIIIGIDGGPDEVIEAARISSAGQLVYTPASHIPLSPNTVEVQDRDPITAINDSDQVIAVWNRDEDIGDAHMDVYVQGFGKDGVLGSTVNSMDTPLSKVEFRLAPNPFRASFEIEFKKEFSVEIVEIYNSAGQLIYKQSQPVKKLKIQTQHWLSGLYLLTARSSEGYFFSRKLIKGQ
ncbi:MAG: T9SS type A sorting domain-containing protein [Saprospiraceae bacterium]|nr:T9SS type A sorting domain-containing protein [Saprospiraceae bacterium]